MKKLNIEEFYATPRYWYHVSTTLHARTYKLKPRSEGCNRSGFEPIDKRICVSPTLEQCITALPYFSCEHTTFFIYKTRYKLKAKSPVDIFDSSVTQEGWIIRPVIFDLVGKLKFDNIVNNRGKSVRIKQEAASVGYSYESRKLHQWWVKINPWKFVTKI